MPTPIGWLAELKRIQSEIHRLFEQILGPQGDVQAIEPNVNILVQSEVVQVVVELPGVQTEDIQVRWINGVLVIEGHKPQGDLQGLRVLQMERAYGPVYRAIPIPWAVNPRQAHAQLQDGWLVIQFPRILDRRTHRIVIPVQSPDA